MIWKRKKTIAILALILLIATATRLYGINSESLWFDEAFSVYHAQQSLGHIVTLPESTPPLYLITLHFFTKVFGNSEFWVRMPSLIFGVLSVLLIFLLAKKIFNQKVGVYASLLLAFSSYHVYYSQEARTYSLLVFLSILSMYFFVNYLTSNRRYYGVLYAISTALLLYSHVYALFLVLAQNVVYVYSMMDKKKWLYRIKEWSLFQFLLFIIYAPWMGIFLSQIRVMNAGSWITTRNILDVFFVSFGYSGGVLLGLLYSALFVYGCYEIMRGRKMLSRSQAYMVLLALWIILPIVIPVIYSLLISPIFFCRYIIFCIIPFFIIIAYGLTKIRRPVANAIMIIAVLLSIFYLVEQTKAIEKNQWENVIEQVNTIKSDNDVILLDYGYNILPFLYYYNQDCFQDKYYFYCASHINVFPIWYDLDPVRNSLEYEKELVDNNSRIIYIRAQSEFMKKATIREYLRNNYNVTSIKKFPTSLPGYADMKQFLQYTENKGDNLLPTDSEVQVYYFEKHTNQ